MRFMSQFNCCPFIWTCHSPENNNKINGLHKRCLRIICNDMRLSFHALLEKDGSFPIHERNSTFSTLSQSIKVLKVYCFILSITG